MISKGTHNTSSITSFQRNKNAKNVFFSFLKKGTDTSSKSVNKHDGQATNSTVNGTGRSSSTDFFLKKNSDDECFKILTTRERNLTYTLVKSFKNKKNCGNRSHSAFGSTSN